MNATQQLTWTRRLVASVFLVRMTALANLLPFPLAKVNGLLYGWPIAEQVTIAWRGAVFPASLVLILCFGRTLTALAFMFGVRARFSGLMAALLACAVQTQNPFGAFYTLKLLYLAMAVVAIAEPRDVYLVRALVASVYIWSSIAKLHHGWLDGSTLLALVDTANVRGDVARTCLLVPAWRTGIAWATPVVEATLGAVFAFGSRNARRVAVVAAIFFHLSIEYTLRPDVIGLLMGALLICAWPSDDTQRSEAGTPSSAKTA